MDHHDHARSPEQKVALIQQMIDCFNVGDAEGYLASVTDDFFWKADMLEPIPGELRGRRQVILWLTKLVEIFPGIRFEPDELLPGDKSLTVLGKASADGAIGYMGLPPRMTPWKHDYCMIYFFNEKGQVRGNWYFYDSVGFLQRLGFVPELSMFGLPRQNRHAVELDFDFELEKPSDEPIHRNPALPPGSLAAGLSQLTRIPFTILASGLDRTSRIITEWQHRQHHPGATSRNPSPPRYGSTGRSDDTSAFDF